MFKYLQGCSVTCMFLTHGRYLGRSYLRKPLELGHLQLKGTDSLLLEKNFTCLAALGMQVKNFSLYFSHAYFMQNAKV